MANSDDSTRAPAHQPPDQLAEVRQRRQQHASPRPTARRSEPRQATPRDPGPPDGAKRPDRDRRLTGALVAGGLGIDDPAPDDVLEAMTNAPSSPAPPLHAPDDAADARVEKAAERSEAYVTDTPDADNWLRHHHERHQPQRIDSSRPRGSAELPTEATRVAAGRKRVPSRRPAKPKATAAEKVDGRRRRHPRSRRVIAVILAAVMLVVAVAVMTEDGGHKARTDRVAAARVLSDGWRGDDPRSSEHPVFSPPVVLTSIHFGRGARSAALLVAKPIHRQPAAVSDAGPSTSSGSAIVATEQSSDATSPQTTYTSPTTATTTPTTSTGSGGGSGSTGSSADSHSSSTTTTPAWGPTGSLGPGSSPDG
jgi:hypothetical protein